MERSLPPILEHTVPFDATPTTSASTQDGKSRLVYLSTLKSFLTALVILHHTAVAYGGAGQHVYHSSDDLPGSQPILVAFNALNQTFFMALFFFVAGFFSRRGLERRMRKDGVDGIGAFVRERVWRLGVPTLVYSVAAPVFCRVAVAVSQNHVVDWVEALRLGANVRGVRGPVWFCALLLIFDGSSAAFWTLRQLMSEKEYSLQPRKPFATMEATTAGLNTKRINNLQLAASLSPLTLADFLWRIPFPVGGVFELLNLNLGYLPQYIAAYVFGLSIPEPLHAVPGHGTLLSFGAVSLASGILLACRMKDGRSVEQALRGTSLQAVAYAFWNNFSGYLLGSILLYLFHQHFNAAWSSITNLTYSAFLLHIPVSTVVQLSFESWQAGPVTKTAIVGALNVVSSWTAAWAWNVVWLGLRRILFGAPSVAAQKHASAPRKRTLSRGERPIEILEGLDQVGC